MSFFRKNNGAALWFRKHENQSGEIVLQLSVSSPERVSWMRNACQSEERTVVKTAERRAMLLSGAETVERCRLQEL
jgi:hypothetical protein